jgi:hypothetical protein
MLKRGPTHSPIVFIMRVSPAQTPVEGLLTLVPEEVTSVGLILINCGDVPAEKSRFGPSNLNENLLPTESSNTICGISSPVIPEGNMVTLLAIIG